MKSILCPSAWSTTPLPFLILNNALLIQRNRFDGKDVLTRNLERLPLDARNRHAEDAVPIAKSNTNCSIQRFLKTLLFSLSNFIFIYLILFHIFECNAFCTISQGKRSFLKYLNKKIYFLSCKKIFYYIFYLLSFSLG